MRKYTKRKIYKRSNNRKYTNKYGGVSNYHEQLRSKLSSHGSGTDALAGLGANLLIRNVVDAGVNSQKKNLDQETKDQEENIILENPVVQKINDELVNIGSSRLKATVGHIVDGVADFAPFVGTALNIAEEFGGLAINVGQTAYDAYEIRKDVKSEVAKQSEHIPEKRLYTDEQKDQFKGLLDLVESPINPLPPLEPEVDAALNNISNPLNILLIKQIIQYLIYKVKDNNNPTTKFRINEIRRILEKKINILPPETFHPSHVPTTAHFVGNAKPISHSTSHASRVPVQHHGSINPHQLSNHIIDKLHRPHHHIDNVIHKHLIAPALKKAGIHPHSLPSHPHSLPSHPHSLPSHPHSLPSHPHSLPSHPHSLPSPSHDSSPSHSHEQSDIHQSLKDRYKLLSDTQPPSLLNLLKEAQIAKDYTQKASRVVGIPSLIQAATAAKLLQNNFIFKLKKKYSKKKKKKILHRDITTALLLKTLSRKLKKIQQREAHKKSKSKT